MTLADFPPVDRLQIAARVARLCERILAFHAARRADLSRRLSLNSLLFMPVHQLRDLGISIHDVMRAMDDPNGCYRK